MKQVPLVSIALCTYNGERYLAEQLDSLTRQTYPAIEIIVVDDCSQDKTLAILTGYAQKYPQFKIYRNDQNLGFVKNFERAINLCTAGLIALCDQDDIWHPEKIECQVNALKDNLLIYHDSEFIDEDGVSMEKKLSGLKNFYRGDEPEVFLFENCVSGHAILMKRELLNAALPLSTVWFHDWWLAYVATNVGRIDFIPQCLVKYRQHNNSNTNILQLGRETGAPALNFVEKIDRQSEWLEHCAAFKGNKKPDLIAKFYRAYKKKMNGFISIELSKLLFKYRKTIFFIRKKSRLSKFNYMLSQIWGIKTKNLYSR